MDNDAAGGFLILFVIAAVCAVIAGCLADDGKPYTATAWGVIAAIIFGLLVWRVVG